MKNSLTPEMTSALLARYPNEPTPALSVEFGIAESYIQHVASKFKVRKTPEFILSQKSEKGRRISAAMKKREREQPRANGYLALRTLQEEIDSRADGVMQCVVLGPGHRRYSMA